MTAKQSPKLATILSVITLIGATASPSMSQAEEITALFGKGYSGFRNATIAYQATPFWQRQLFARPLDLSLEYSLGVSQAAEARQNGTLWHIGITPMFRWWFQHRTAVEFGIGANLFSGTHIGYKNISTAYQFGDSIGILHRFNRTPWSIGLRFTHYSNAGIKNPNPGQGYFQIRFSRILP